MAGVNRWWGCALHLINRRHDQPNPARHTMGLCSLRPSATRCFRHVLQVHSCKKQHIIHTAVDATAYLQRIKNVRHAYANGCRLICERRIPRIGKPEFITKVRLVVCSAYSCQETSHVSGPLVLRLSMLSPKTPCHHPLHTHTRGSPWNEGCSSDTTSVHRERKVSRYVIAICRFVKPSWACLGIKAWRALILAPEFHHYCYNQHTTTTTTLLLSSYIPPPLPWPS